MLSLDGRIVSEIAANQILQAGEHRFAFDTGALTQGVYLLQAISGDKTETNRFVVVR